VKDDRIYLEHIRDAILQIASYTTTGREAFFRERLIQDAVLRNLEIIGEAVKNLSMKTRAGRPEIEWGKIAGMRDVLVHDYFGVDLVIVWDAVENRLPKLKQAVESLMQT